MNILHLAKELNFGGLSKSIIDLNQSLLINNNSYVISSGGSQLADINYKGFNHEILNFKSKNPFIFLSNLYKLYCFIKIHRIEIIHSHNRITSFYAQIIKIIIRIPFVWSLQQEHIPSNLIYRILTFSGNLTIAPSNEIKDFLIEKLKIKKNKIRVIRNGISFNYSYFNKEKEIHDFKLKFDLKDEKIITLLGRFVPEKGHGLLIESLKYISKSSYRVIFLGVSDSEYKSYIMNLAKKYNLLENIIFLGYVPAQIVLNITDLMVLPSYKDGITLAVLESFYNKVPVIKSKTSGITEIKNLCITIRVGDLDDLTSKIQEFINGKDYSNMVETAYNFVINECSIEAMSNQVEVLYKDLIKKEWKL